MKKLLLLSSLLLIPLITATLFISDGPNSWTQLLSGQVVFNDCIAINPTNPQIIYAGTNGAGVYMTTDGGTTWNQVNTGLTDLAVQVLTISNSSPTTLYAGCITGGMFKTTNSGTSWTQIISGINEIGKNVQAIAVKPNDPNTVVICLYDGVNNATDGVYKTTNGGTSWVVSTTGILSPNHNFLSMATPIAAPNTVYLGGTFVASTWGVHVYKSYNFGSTWIDISNGIDTTLATGIDPFRDLSISTIDTNTVLAGRFFNTTNGGPWLTTNGGTTWVPKPGGIPVAAGLLVRSCKIKPGSNSEFYLGLNATTTTTFGGVWRTTNGGTTWTSFNSTVMDTTKTVRSLNYRTSDNTLYAGVAATTIGTTGVYAYTFVPPPPPVNRALLLPTPGVNTNYVAIPHQSSMVGFTNITIEGWMKPGSFALANTLLNHGGVNFDYQLGVSTAGTTGTPFFRAISTIVTASSIVINAGVWTHLAVTYDGTTCKFYVNGALGYSQTIALPFGSTTTEMRIGRGNADPGSGNIEELRLWSVARTQGQIDSNRCVKFPSAFSGGTTGLKALWHFDSTYVDSISGYNGTPQGTVGFDTLTFPHPSMSCGLVGIKTENNEVPKSFNLSQNYPNPFNPKTIIEFSLPKGEFVEIVLYDILGRKVATLLSEPKQAGKYQLTVDGTNLASGVYFYKMVAGSFSDTKKMLMIK